MRNVHTVKWLGFKKEKKKQENLLNSSKEMGDSRYRARYLCSEGYALMPYATRTKESLRTYTDGDIMHPGYSNAQADIAF